MMDLVVAENCPFCHRCLLVLHDKEASFRPVEIDLTGKDKVRNQLSPYGRVPILRHEGQAIYESSIINEYLEDVLPSPPLLPSDAAQKATARFWIDFCNTRLVPAYFNLLKERDPTLREPLRTALLDHLRFIETIGLARASETAPYWLGRDVTLVDYAFYPFFERFASVEAYRGVAIPPAAQRLQGWLTAMRRLEAVRTLARPRDYYVDYFARYYADS